MERAFTIGWRIGVLVALIYIAVAQSFIMEDAHTTAESMPAIEQDLAVTQDRLDSLHDGLESANTNVAKLWTLPFCYSVTEDSVMMGCVYEDGGWYRKDNGDGFGVDAAA